MAPENSPYRTRVTYYAGDGSGEKWKATYHSRVKADKAIARAAEVLGWIGIITEERKP
jgi:hypothetical protein